MIPKLSSLTVSLIYCDSYRILNSFAGLVLEGASWTSDRLALNAGESVRLGASQIRWVQVDDKEGASADVVSLPVYLNNDRSDVLFTVKLPFNQVDGQLVAMRAVCLTADG